MRHSVRPGRVAAVMEFGFTERQARFLVHVLVFSGVFLERQYRAFTGLVHGRKTQDFLTRLIDDAYATAITPGALHRGRFFHVQYKPLYEAIGEANNRHRKGASLGRFVERLMLLDAVLADHRHGRLGTEQDKRTYFREALERQLPDDFYPHLTFGSGAEKTTQFFPDKMPLGVPLNGERHVVFVYLATREVPMDFRAFLLRHTDLLKAVDEWTIRVLMPRRLRRVATLYRYAVRDTFLMPLDSREVRELDWYFRARQCELRCPSPDPDLTVAAASCKYGAARFEALYRAWLQGGEQALWAMQSPLLRDNIQRGWGRVEFVQLLHQYLQLTPLLGTVEGVEKDLSQEDNLITA
jgi:hypothetical protein